MYRALVTLSLLTAPLAFVPTGVEAQSQRAQMEFEAMDRNKDGVIARDEWQGFAWSFQVRDWNDDGRLSGREVRAGAQRNTNWEEADRNPNRAERYVAWTVGGFNNLDRNRDRRVTQNEWHYDLETFRRVDRNRDNALTQAEFRGRRSGRR